jgi:hypothetical protein
MVDVFVGVTSAGGASPARTGGNSNARERVNGVTNCEGLGARDRDPSDQAGGAQLVKH